MNNFISIVKHFNLVIYTDEKSVKYIDTKENKRIKVIIKPFEQFYNYKYKDFWIKNHEKNVYLNDRVDWAVNMLWSEKIWFVKETIERKYFKTEFYGWCDIGYFRNRTVDLHTIYLENWCNNNYSLCKVFNKDKIVYGCINNDRDYINKMYRLINTKNENGLPVNYIPHIQQSIAGGFFIIHKDKISWWSETYDKMLKNYFENNYLVKDDQIILANCIFDNELKNNFTLYRESKPPFDNWFMFQRILS
jgi:hypothetical protein